VMAGAGKLAVCVARSGGDGVTWRGEEGPVEAGKWWARVLEGTWREVEQRGAAGAREDSRRGRWGHGREQSRGRTGGR
jgi:hypothetical protein